MFGVVRNEETGAETTTPSTAITVSAYKQSTDTPLAAAQRLVTDVVLPAAAVADTGGTWHCLCSAIVNAFLMPCLLCFFLLLMALCLPVNH